MLTIILIIGSLFLCYYFKCYPYIYTKFLEFYRWARRPKIKTNSRGIVRFENVPEHGEPRVALAPSAEQDVTVLENPTFFTSPNLLVVLLYRINDHRLCCKTQRLIASLLTFN